ncbi:hypothetical protein QEH52_19600 [Coraliomargarita sp. SDUM461003]|uniref:Uncharacterized protein n=2 Tax=Thalassobacterium maritimum TaxID=3041265 RepID=A0ABU1B015_9BACT|nr:hypothetical protein [Coraliomargarita sp. SDUM461003]
MAFYAAFTQGQRETHNDHEEVTNNQKEIRSEIAVQGRANKEHLDTAIAQIREDLERNFSIHDPKAAGITEGKGFCFILIASIKDRDIKSRQYLFDFGDISRNRASAYLAEDNSLIFRVIDNTSESSSVRINQSSIPFNEFSAYSFIYTEKEKGSLLSVFMDGKLIESFTTTIPLKLGEIPKGKGNLAANLEGKENLAMTAANFFTLAASPSEEQHKTITNLLLQM